MQKLSTNMKVSVWKNFNLARTGSSNYNAGHLRGDRWLATRTFPQKEILEKFPQKSCSGMGKGNSYHAHVSYPDCRIFLSHIHSFRHKKKQCFHHFFTTSLPDKQHSALKARPSRNICTRGVTFISHHHRPAPCTEIKVSSKDIWRRWKFAYLSNVYSNFPLNNFYSRSNSLSSTPPLSALLIRVLNIQARNHFVCWGGIWI